MLKRRSSNDAVELILWSRDNVSLIAKLCSDSACIMFSDSGDSRSPHKKVAANAVTEVRIAGCCSIVQDKHNEVMVGAAEQRGNQTNFCIYV